MFSHVLPLKACQLGNLATVRRGFAVFFHPPLLKIFKRDGVLIFESKKIFYGAGATDDAWIRHGVMADLFAFDLSAFQASIALPIGEARAGRGDRLFGRKAAAFAFDFKKQTEPNFFERSSSVSKCTHVRQPTATLELRRRIFPSAYGCPCLWLSAY